MRVNPIVLKRSIKGLLNAGVIFGVLAIVTMASIMMHSLVTERLWVLGVILPLNIIFLIVIFKYVARDRDGDFYLEDAIRDIFVLIIVSIVVFSGVALTLWKQSAKYDPVYVTLTLEDTEDYYCKSSVLGVFNALETDLYYEALHDAKLSEEDARRHVEILRIALWDLDVSDARIDKAIESYMENEQRAKLKPKIQNEEEDEEKYKAGDERLAKIQKEIAKSPLAVFRDESLYGKWNHASTNFSMFLDMHLFWFLDLIPIFNIPETLEVCPTVAPGRDRSRFLLLVYKLYIFFGIFVVTSKLWQSARR